MNGNKFLIAIVMILMASSMHADDIKTLREKHISLVDNIDIQDVQKGGTSLISWKQARNDLRKSENVTIKIKFEINENFFNPKYHEHDQKVIYKILSYESILNKLTANQIQLILGHDISTLPPKYEFNEENVIQSFFQLQKTIKEFNEWYVLQKSKDPSFELPGNEKTKLKKYFDFIAKKQDTGQTELLKFHNTLKSYFEGQLEAFFNINLAVTQNVVPKTPAIALSKNSPLNYQDLQKPNLKNIRKMYEYIIIEILRSEGKSPQLAQFASDIKIHVTKLAKALDKRLMERETKINTWINKNEHAQLSPLPRIFGLWKSRLEYLIDEFIEFFNEFQTITQYLIALKLITDQNDNTVLQPIQSTYDQIITHLTNLSKTGLTDETINKASTEALIALVTAHKNHIDSVIAWYNRKYNLNVQNPKPDADKNTSPAPTQIKPLSSPDLSILLKKSDYKTEEVDTFFKKLDVTIKKIPRLFTTQSIYFDQVIVIIKRIYELQLGSEHLHTLPIIHLRAKYIKLEMKKPNKEDNQGIDMPFFETELSTLQNFQRKDSSEYIDTLETILDTLAMIEQNNDTRTGLLQKYAELYFKNMPKDENYLIKRSDIMKNYPNEVIKNKYFNTALENVNNINTLLIIKEKLSKTDSILNKYDNKINELTSKSNKQKALSFDTSSFDKLYATFKNVIGQNPENPEIYNQLNDIVKLITNEFQNKRGNLEFLKQAYTILSKSEPFNRLQQDDLLAYKYLKHKTLALYIQESIKANSSINDSGFISEGALHYSFSTTYNFLTYTKPLDQEALELAFDAFAMYATKYSNSSSAVNLTESYQELYENKFDLTDEALKNRLAKLNQDDFLRNKIAVDALKEIVNKTTYIKISKDVKKAVLNLQPYKEPTPQESTQKKRPTLKRTKKS